MIRYDRLPLSLPIGEMINGRPQEDSKSRKEIQTKARKEGRQKIGKEGKEEGVEEKGRQEEIFEEASNAQAGEENSQEEGRQDHAKKGWHQPQGSQKEGFEKEESGQAKGQSEVERHPAFLRRSRPHTIDRDLKPTARPEHDIRRRIVIEGAEL